MDDFVGRQRRGTSHDRGALTPRHLEPATVDWKRGALRSDVGKTVTQYRTDLLVHLHHREVTVRATSDHAAAVEAGQAQAVHPSGETLLGIGRA
jgi:aspartate carbamoyltransferase catalytic subunit